MRREAYQLSVSTNENDGTIEIRQPWPPQEDDSMIAISPDQVDTLIAWLKEAQQEIRNTAKESFQRSE